MSDINVKGLAELQQFLDTLPAKLEANVMRGGLRAGANIVAAEVRANVPVKHGDLRDSIRVGTSRRDGVVRARVRAGGKKAWYARLIEFTGAKAHEIRPKNKKSLFFAGLAREQVQHPGFKPRPFLRPALDARAVDAVVACAEYVKARLARKNGLDTSGVTIEAER